MINEFKEFISKGSAIDLAVGVVIGAAFTAIVKSLVDGVIMPLAGLLLGSVDFTNLFIVLKPGGTAGPYPTLAAAQAAGAVVISWGVLVNAIVSFAIVALVLFLLIKAINKVRRPAEEPALKDCPFCLTEIAAAASRCPACTSELPAS
jgi:large conductance mechanosensitive channel